MPRSHRLDIKVHACTLPRALAHLHGDDDARGMILFYVTWCVALASQPSLPLLPVFSPLLNRRQFYLQRSSGAWVGWCPRQ